METIELLKKNLLFKGCTAEDFDLLSGLIQERQVKPNTTLFSEKMPAEALYIVKSGKIKISVMEGEGEEVGLLELGPGDFFGEVVLRATSVYTAGTTASVSTTEIITP